MIVAGRYPSDADWAALNVTLQPLLAALPDAGATISLDGWKGSISQLAGAPGEKLTDKPPSWQVVLVAPHHKNEAHNLESKLDEARANIVRHSDPANANRRHGLLVRLHEGASPATCVAWVDAYLRDRPDSPLDLVLLYQAAAVQNVEADTTGLTHTIVPVTTPRFRTWLPQTGKRLTFQFLVGTVNTEPTTMKLMSDRGVELILDRAYFYQRGEIFDLYEADANGVINGNLRNPTSGIQHHAIMRSANIGGELEIRGKFPPTNDVTMFD